ncbi:hypothetical protein PB2503_00612 [Parvularcula bermudensis HTCC2503]|uniref:HNH endonuclease n=1 Tax=Parvularcula bermudensis (strain ATCC BAA-594 / HTCC2503 / KCTC 12087) TaxID=314260 RepID=E0TAZ4_PARBH|nr:HNH endonuclease [Parvularcula bermudensis]ADM08203.1 hypothetical protein PB2503_00612 [Parvularcula bermudensis HTCC2503]
MRSIPLLAVDATGVFDEIAAAKRQPRRQRIQAVRSKVLTAYEAYNNVVPEVGGLAKVQMTDKQKHAMRHAYTVETQPMTKLRGELLERTIVARCPFCGIGETSTLDHYLPKEEYPEFSVFPNNLVPSCSVCNTHKRVLIVDEGTSVRMFLHPCYDSIPDENFLSVRVRMEADALILSYGLRQPIGMALVVFQRLRTHFSELKLANRYRRMAFEHLGGQYRSLRRTYGPNKNPKRVAEQLIEGAGDFEDRFGPNYWLARLYRALAADAEFCGGGFEALQVHAQQQ